MVMAAKGGYEAVQMRAVAEQAEVALGTLYRYFPSKIHLLVSALARELARVQERSEHLVAPGATSYDRLTFLLTRITKRLQREPRATAAMTRAFMFADTTAAAEVDQVGHVLEQMLARVMVGSEAPLSTDQLAIARIISDLWLWNLVARVTGRESAADAADRLDLTIGLLLGVRHVSDTFSS